MSKKRDDFVWLIRAWEESHAKNPKGDFVKGSSYGDVEYSLWTKRKTKDNLRLIFYFSLLALVTIIPLLFH